jgi:hypothetical protein
MLYTLIENIQLYSFDLQNIFHNDKMYKQFLVFQCIENSHLDDTISFYLLPIFLIKLVFQPSNFL